MKNFPIVSCITSEGNNNRCNAYVDCFKVVLKEQDKLQEKADKEGDFLYLRFTEFEIGHFNSTVSLDNGWIQHKGAEGMYLSGGGFKLKYHNILGFWREDPMKQSWIS